MGHLFLVKYLEKAYHSFRKCAGDSSKDEGRAAGSCDSRVRLGLNGPHSGSGQYVRQWSISQVRSVEHRRPDYISEWYQPGRSATLYMSDIHQSKLI